MFRTIVSSFFVAFALAFVAVAPAHAKREPVDARAVVGAPVEGKARIVFFRPSKFVGGAVGFKVRENGTVLGKLRSGKYFIADVEPGAHAYTVHSEVKDVLNIEVEAGETYYVAGSITMGFLAGRPNLSPSTFADFEKALPKMKPAKPVSD